MKNIQVKVIDTSHPNPEGLMMFLARLTQRGHAISNMDDLMDLYSQSIIRTDEKVARNVAALPHGTIRRFSTFTIAIVGASRRFLAQARTHHVGLNWMSGSLQYSDYSNTEDAFVVPYELTVKDEVENTTENTALFLNECKRSLRAYQEMIDSGIDNDTSGYLMPQAMRNVLIVQGNTEALQNMIQLRTCKRNTEETQYVYNLMLEALREKSPVFFDNVGPFCFNGKCLEGSMSCASPVENYEDITDYIDQNWSLIRRR